MAFMLGVVMAGMERDEGWGGGYTDRAFSTTGLYVRVSWTCRLRS